MRTSRRPESSIYLYLGAKLLMSFLSAISGRAVALLNAKRQLGIIAATVVLVVSAATTGAHAESPAKFMQRVANQLITATRSGSSAAIGKVVTNYADVYSIGLSALGSYAPRMKRSDRPAYHRGIVRFIARYAANESPKYPVAKAVMLNQSKGGHNVYYVDSRIVMKTGQSYDVRWVIYKRGSTYKVRDAEVIGMRATSFLETLFQKYIGDNGGNPRALIAALNK